MISYRGDIDGLRAFAVIAVILFHLGYLPNGYLGVDVFFVISGYLITSIIYNQLKENNFSIWQFYERRIRRILPLLLFISSTAFIIGLFVMLPHDLEELAQSVVASNFSANNIHLLISSSDYWAVENEYKPLMHTWSLGVEEQFYIIYPFLLLLFHHISLRTIKKFLLTASIASIILFLFFGTPESRFYLLHYRFFELSLGGFFAIVFMGKQAKNSFFKYIYGLSAIGLIASITFINLGNQSLSIITTILSVITLVTGSMTNKQSHLIKRVLENKIIVYVGKISFSLYMWHQVIFAFSRYAFFEVIDYKRSIVLLVFVFILSILTYHFIENPFRNKTLLSTKKVMTILGIVFIVSSSSALYIYFVGGVYKDFPSLGLTTEIIKDKGYNSFFSQDVINLHYNENVRTLDKPFPSTNKKPNILVIGDSFGRDVANILMEHPESSKIDLSYFDINRTLTDTSIVKRLMQSKLIIFAANGFISKHWVSEMGRYHNFKIDFSKVLVFGTKNYGYSNGIQYNNLSSITDFSEHYTIIKDDVMEVERRLKDEWEDRYVSLMHPLMNSNGEIRVFDDTGKFISHDTFHLTKAGAKLYSKILKAKISNILER